MRKPRFILLAIMGLLLFAALATHGTLAARPSPLACHPSYPDFCIPPPPPDLDCPDIRGKKPFRVRQPDPHRFDRERDGWGCEPRRHRRN